MPGIMCYAQGLFLRSMAWVAALKIFFDFFLTFF